MKRSLHRLLSLALLLAACTPTASGPLLPRPSPAPEPTTTTLAATTTTANVAAAAALRGEVDAAPDCPTDFCAVYHINPSATWSDGDPVTPDDFAHTVQLLGGLPGEGLSSPYPAVASVDEVDARTVRVAFDRPNGGWNALFERVFREGRPAGSIADVDTTGPFVLGEWAEGEYLTLERDPGWWAVEDPISGARLGDIQRVRFVFIESLDEMLDALDRGEVDVVTARPDSTSMERLAGMDGVEHVVQPGPFWEHIDFHHEDPILSQLWARRAISLAIDREEILERTVRLIDPSSTGLDNTVWMSGTPDYEPHYDDAFDPGAAEQILIDEGCIRGEDGIYVCQGERMSFVWATTSDDPARVEIYESAREDLAAVGIEVVGDFRSPSAFVTRDFLFGGPDQWQMINFSWRAREDPIAANPTYYCDDTGALNVNRFCSEDVERLIRATATITDPGERAATYNTADRLYLEDRPLIPLYQKPSLMAWSSEITGPEPNHSISGDLWNVASWSGKDEVVVALPSEPDLIDPRSRADNSANVILGALLYGAFGMDPSHELIPVLVERVELVDDTR
jgi:peptide/nickel transport system substrate-binding protein